jgi:polysaccharide export outer membrane protein
MNYPFPLNEKRRLLGKASRAIPRSRQKELTTVAAAVISSVGALLFGGCHTPAPPPLQQMAAPTQVTLASGDVVRLAFLGAPDLNQAQKIRADGKINLPLIGEVHAAGKTIATLQSELSARYKPQLTDATLIVILDSSVTQVVVSGAVGKPAKFSFERPTTVFQAIMEAGGATDYGTLKTVHLTRLINGQEHTQILDLRPTMVGRTTSPFYVRDGDVIYVPQTLF